MHQPFPPVGVFFANLRDFRPAAPARAVIIPYHFDFADVAQGAFVDQLLGGNLVGLAAVLGADLHNQVAREHGVPRHLGLLQIIGHGLFAVRIFAGFRDEAQDRGMLEIGGRDDDRVDVFLRDEVIHVLISARRAAIHRLCASGGLLAVHLPEIADRGHLDVLFILELGNDPGQFRASVAYADVAQENALVRAFDA